MTKEALLQETVESEWIVLRNRRRLQGFKCNQDFTFNLMSKSSMQVVQPTYLVKAAYVRAKSSMQNAAFDQTG